MRQLLLGAVLLALAVPAWAQGGPADLIAGNSELSLRSVQLIGLITVLSLVPGIAVMVTCFPFIVTVLSILRQAIGLQQAPPNMLIVSLSMFLTWFVMDPVLQEAWQAGIGPFSRGEMELQQAFPVAMQPVRAFLAARLDPDTFAALLDLRPGFEGAAVDAPLSLLVPSFMLSEIQRAFEVGFLIYLPFLVIDMVVSAILMSMGMMMVPPAIVSLPVKLAFFVVADGWALVTAALVRGYTG